MDENFTLGEFLQQQLKVHELSNRQLALKADIAESAVRNMLQHGLDVKAKDPDPKTLNAVANALQMDAIPLFQYAGYIPFTRPQKKELSRAAQLVRILFDQLSPEKQTVIEAVIRALDKMDDYPSSSE